MPSNGKQKVWKVGLKAVYREEDLPDPKNAAAPSVAPLKVFDSRKPPGGKISQETQ